MIDFLYRFSVLNTAFSTIGNEIKQKLGQLGGPWFHLLSMWILYIVAADLWNTGSIAFQMTNVVLVGFLVTTLYLDTVHYGAPRLTVISRLDNKPVKQVLSTVQYIAFIPVVWKYVWPPIVIGVRMVQTFVVGDVDSKLISWICTICSVLLVFVVVMLVHSGTAPVPRSRKRRASVGRQRQPSARIQAKLLHEQRSNNSAGRPASASRRRSRY